jgi:SAM-dependent methyltransferase
VLAARVCLDLGAVCRRLFHFAPPVDLDAEGHDEAHFRDELSRARQFPSRFAVPPELGDRDVLELGCGFGGLTAWLIGESPASVTAIDPDERRLAFASRHVPEAKMLVAAAENVPLPSASVDVIVSDAVLEHVHDVSAVFGEVGRLLRPGGSFFARWGPSWLTWNGPHLIKVLGVPWVQLLFSDRTIVSALEQLRGREDVPARYLEYKLEDFQQMGRVTRRKVRRAAKAAGLVVVQEDSHSPHVVLNLAANLPVLSELFAGELSLLARKPASSGVASASLARRGAA